VPPRPRELAVWANGLRIGEWRMPARAAMEFEYTPEWSNAPEARPLSLSLPLTLTSYRHRGKPVEAYFDNLLPDSDPIRRRLQQRFSTESREAFDLLGAIGRDCVGAIQLLPLDEQPAGIRKIDAQPLSDREIEAELAGLTSPNPLAGGEEFRISIAGAQEKTAFLLHKGRWCRPVDSTPTSHIFKLPLGLVGNRRTDLSTSVENEWLCSLIATHLGLPVANTKIGRFGDQKVLIVERFDRQLHSSGKYWLRLMQEDFAQATGTPWHRKYQSDGGPGIAELGRLLRQSADSNSDLATLFRAQLTFFLLAATDGHCKNFSIRLLAGGLFRLTPLYDVLSAWPVIGRRNNEIPYEKVKLAMALPGRRPHYQIKSLQRRHFERLGAMLGLGAKTSAIIDETVSAVPGAITAVTRELPRGFPVALAERVFDGMARHARSLALS
jgi:serine/threonine-protein kinase HipA